MRLNIKDYRKKLYAQRAHPVRPYTESDNHSFQSLYLSMPFFIFVEYITELKIDALPQGLIFPVGFLIFWAFFYTYQQPGFLEHRLKSSEKWDLFSIPTVILGALLWFVKVAVVEFAEIILERWLLDKREVPQPRRAQASIPPLRSALPRDVQTALVVLGLKDCRDWSTIQRRYRELAKLYHPDLNPEKTTAGNRFMIYDEAYRKLHAVREKHFQRPAA